VTVAAPSSSRRHPTWTVAVVVACVALPLLIAGGLRLRHWGAVLGQQLTAGLICDSRSHDFSVVSPESAAALTHAVQITNGSDHTITIVKVTQSCGCTKAAISKTTLRPHESGTLTVNLDWRDRDGQQSASVWLSTDEASRSTGTITLRAFVANRVLVQPTTLRFERVAPGTSEERIFEVTQLVPDVPLIITGIRTSSPLIEVRRIPASGSGAPPIPGPPGKFRVRVTVPRFKWDSTGFLRISTSTSVEYLVAVYIETEGAIVAAPQSVVFDSSSSAAASTEVHLQLPADSGARTVATDVLTSGEPPAFIVGPVTIDGERHPATATVTVRYKPGQRRAVLQRLRVRCGSDVLDIPVAVIGYIE